MTTHQDTGYPEHRVATHGLRCGAAGAKKYVTSAASTVTSNPPPAHGGPGRDAPLDRLARLVSSEAFAVAFLWWASLVLVTPTCLAWCVHHYRNGTISLALGFGFAAVVIGTVALYRLAAITPRMRSAVAT